MMLGNSYTGQIKGTLSQLVGAEKLPVTIKAFTPGGKTLTWHVENGAAEKIKADKYDLVIMQEQSQTPALPGHREKFHKAVGQLSVLAKKHGAKPVLYMTWGRRDGDKKNPKLFPDYGTMQDKLTANYRKAGKAAGATVVPIGEIWAEVRRLDPELGRKLYRGDGSHPSAHGATLVSMAFACSLFGETPASLDFRGPCTEAEFEIFKQAVAKVSLEKSVKKPKE